MPFLWRVKQHIDLESEAVSYYMFSNHRAHCIFSKDAERKALDFSLYFSTFKTYFFGGKLQIRAAKDAEREVMDKYLALFKQHRFSASARGFSHTCMIIMTLE